MSNYELYHHGRKGMKWGIRRYQNKDGSLTPAGKKRYGIKQVVETIKTKQKIKKEVQAEIEKRAQEEKKQKILKEGSAEDVLSIRGQLSDKELIDAVNRLRSVQSLEAMKPHVKTGMERAEDIMNKASKVKGFVDKGIDIYNTAAKINNSFNDKKWQTIDGKGKDKKAEAKEKEAKRIEDIVKKGSSKDAIDNFGSFTVKDLNSFIARRKAEKTIRDDYAAEKAQEAVDMIGRYSAKENQNRAKNGKDFALLLGFGDDEAKHSDSLMSMTLDELYHHGVKGMKWGVRRYQNYDGTLIKSGAPITLTKEDRKHLAQKRRRSKLTIKQTEKELKDIYESDCRPPYTDRRAEELQEEIETYSGDHRRVEGVSKNFKQAVANYEQRIKPAAEIEEKIDALINEHISTKNPPFSSKELDEWIYDAYKKADEILTPARIAFYKEATNAVLKDLGYKDSPKIRKWISKISGIPNVDD